MDTANLANELLAQLEAIPVIDSHEHLIPEAQRIAVELDVLCLLGDYSRDDLSAAGCPPQTVDQIVSPQAPLPQRWQLLKPYWPKIRNTSHARMFTHSMHELFNCTELNEAAIITASQQMQARNRSGWYREVLNERCNITLTLLDRYATGTDCDRQLFAPVIHVLDFIIPRTRKLFDLPTDSLSNLSAQLNRNIHSVDELVEAAHEHITAAKEQGAVAIKIIEAYWRTLHFAKVTHNEAQRVFNRLTTQSQEGMSPAEAKPLQDYMIHTCIQAALENNMTIIFHTGLQAEGQNIITNTNPTLLTNLFLEYKQARFDLFHAGYPYGSECGVLAKYFPNVWVNLAWTHMLSAAGARQILRDWLDLIPASKVIGFGGDVEHVELVCGHLHQARGNLATVLAERIARGEDAQQQALHTARLLLHDNAVAAYLLTGC